MTCSNIVLGKKQKRVFKEAKGVMFENTSNYCGGEGHAGAHLGRGVDPDSSIEQDVVTQLLQ